MIADEKCAVNRTSEDRVFPRPPAFAPTWRGFDIRVSPGPSVLTIPRPGGDPALRMPASSIDTMRVEPRISPFFAMSHPPRRVVSTPRIQAARSVNRS